jgi:hypothetical protein
VQAGIDARVKATFAPITVTLPAADGDAAASRGSSSQGNQQQQQQQQAGATTTHTFPDLDDAAFAALGRDQPRLLMALLEAAAAADPPAWQAFQVAVQTFKLQRQRLSGQLADARGLLDAAQRQAAKQQGLGPVSDKAALMLQQGGGAGACACASVWCTLCLRRCGPVQAL